MAIFRRVSLLWLLTMLPIHFAPLDLRAADKLSPAQAATRVDTELLRGLSASIRSDQMVDDETFLRRVSIDLTGQLPDPESLRRFLADPAADKRAKIVELYLKSDAYA